MTFGKPKSGSIGPVQFLRIPIGTKNPDGTTGDLILAAPKVYSFGLCVTTSMQTGKPDGYTLPLCLHSRDGPTKEEKDFIQTFNDIVDRARQHVLDIKVSIGKYELEAAELKKMNPLYIKKDKKTGKPEEGVGPVLYPKVMQKAKKNGKDYSDDQEKIVTTLFYDQNGRDIDPLTILEKQGFATAAIKIESIFIGAKISLQVKIHEVEYQTNDNAPKRLRRPEADPVIHGLEEEKNTDSVVNTLSQNVTSSSTPANDNNNSDESSSESDDGSLDESEPSPPQPVVEKKAPVRKMAAKK
jgi:hypothetical protein